MADVLVLASSPAARDQVRRAVRAEAAGGALHDLRAAASWAELFVLAAPATLGVAFVDPYHAGSFAAAEIRRLRERYPVLEVVAYADFAGRPACDAFTLAQLGVRAVVARESADEARLLARSLAQALNHAPLEALAGRLGEVLSPSIHRWLAPVLRAPEDPRTVPALAARAGCSPRTLRRTLAAAGLPTPEQLLAWRRLLHAARLLEGADRSAESVARALDYSSGAALRRSLRTLAGLRPTELARPGGLRLLAGRFLRACGDPEARHDDPARTPLSRAAAPGRPMAAA